MGFDGFLSSVTQGHAGAWSGFLSPSHHYGSFLPRFAFIAVVCLLVCFLISMDSLWVNEKGGRERVGVEGKGDLLINVPANESMTNKNELGFTECDLFTHYYN